MTHMQQASELMATGHYKEASKVCRKLYQDSAREMGQDAALTLRAGALYAKCLRHMDDHHEEANTLLRQVYDARCRVLGAEHADSLESMSEVADVHLMRGELTEAQELYTQLFERRKRTLGADHAQTLSALAKLATLHSKMGRAEEALAAETQVWLAEERVFGPCARLVTTCLEMAKLLISHFGRCSEGLYFARHAYVLHAALEESGEDSSWTTATAGEMPPHHIRSKSLEVGALTKPQQHSRHFRSATVAIDHASHFTQPYQVVGQALKFLKRYEEALPFFKYVIDEATARFGASHRQVLFAEECLGQLLVAMDRDHSVGMKAGEVSSVSFNLV